MHELSVVGEIIRIVTEHASLYRKSRVERIDLVIGKLTGHCVEMLQYYFDILAKGTDLEGARLHAHYIKPVFTCPECGFTFEKNGASFACPACRTTADLKDRGREFYIDAIVVGKTRTEKRFKAQGHP